MPSTKLDVFVANGAIALKRTRRYTALHVTATAEVEIELPSVGNGNIVDCGRLY